MRLQKSRKTNQSSMNMAKEKMEENRRAEERRQKQQSKKADTPVKGVTVPYKAGARTLGAFGMPTGVTFEAFRKLS